MVRYGGKAPVELENSSPEQLTTPVTSFDQTDQALHKPAMKSDLETRQRADLKRDIAARLLPSEGPFCSNRSVLLAN